MAFVSQAPIRRNSHLVPAALALGLAGLLSPVHLSLFGQSWPLTWLAFAVMALWPRQASPVPSALLLFAGGLWVDWATLGAPGQWALVFALTYAVVRPDQSEPMRGLGTSVWRVVMALLVGVPVFVLSGWFVYGAWPDGLALGRGLLVLLVTLPLIAVLRDVFAGRLTREDH